ncbi:MAG: tetratricopeptide repeat protein [bacterium]
MRSPILRVLFSVLFLVAVFGCAQVIQLPPDAPSCDAPCLTARGWGAYEGGQWGQVGFFFQAIDLDSSFAEAYMGLGYLHIEQGLVSEASIEFQTAIDLDTSLVAAFAGNAYCLAAVRDDVSAIGMALIAIDKGGPDFQFVHNPLITTRNLRLLLAGIYFRNQDYIAAQDQIDLLVPDNTLSPGSREYVTELLQLIESLAETG